MKVTYEFESTSDNDDEYHLKVFQRASDMYQGLLEIDIYLKRLREECPIDGIEEIIEIIQEIVFDTRIGEIE